MHERDKFKINLLGCMTTIEKIGGEKYNLYYEQKIINEFNKGLKAFFVCQQMLIEHALSLKIDGKEIFNKTIEQEKIKKIPMEHNGSTIGGVDTKYDHSSIQEWTTAMKYFLTNL